MNNWLQLLALGHYCYSQGMMDEVGIKRSLERIEAALSRLEAAAGDASVLRRRHRDLKASVSRSLQQLDRLIGDPPA